MFYNIFILYKPKKNKMNNTLTLNEIRLIKEMSKDRKLLLSEGLLSDIVSKIKKKFSPKEKEVMSEKISENLGVDENSSREEIEQKLMEKTNGKPSMLPRVLKEILGFTSMVLYERVFLLLEALLVLYTDYNPIVIYSILIHILLQQTLGYRKMRRKFLGKKTDEFIFGRDKDVDDSIKDDENKINESKKKVVRLTESDLIRLVKRIIKETKN